MISMVMDYVLESSSWSVGGLIVGYVLGRVTERRIHRKGADRDNT